MRLRHHRFETVDEVNEATVPLCCEGIYCQQSTAQPLEIAVEILVWAHHQEFEGVLIKHPVGR